MEDRLETGPGNILVVDDTPDNLRLLVGILADEGHRVRAALDGARALAAARADPPDLILLDIVMPQMDGYEVCRQLKADERTRDVPILFMSALDETGSKLQAFAAGGVDYVTKPFQLAEVLARIRTHLALRNLHRQLQAANAELSRQVHVLEEQNRELDAFARTVAHDIKNPLSIIVGYASLLSYNADDLSEQERDNTLRAIEHQSADLARVVDGLLLLSRVRKEDVPLAPLDMAYLLDSVLRRLAGSIEESAAEVVLPPAGTWPLAWGYAPWVEEVWANYLSNGCRYGGTPPRLEVGADLLAGGHVRFWVRDHGPGILPEDQGRLFVPFTQLGHTRQGHGLGLSIVRRIVTRLGGEVGVESDGLPGQGSCFFFTLPGEGGG